MQSSDDQPTLSGITRESAYRLPNPVGPHRRPLDDAELPDAVRELEGAMREVVGAARRGFEFALVVHVTPAGPVGAKLLPFGESDPDALGRLERCVRERVVTDDSDPPVGFEIYYVVGKSHTYLMADLAAEAAEISGALVRACPSYRGRWERYRAENPRVDVFYVEGVGDFAEHAVDLIAAGRTDDLAAPLDAMQGLVDRGAASSDLARFTLLSGIIARGASRGVDVGPLADVVPAGMREYWSGLWESKDDDLSHDPYW